MYNFQQEFPFVMCNFKNISLEEARRIVVGVRRFIREKRSLGPIFKGLVFMEWYGFLVGTRRYRHHREKGAMHFHSTTYLSFIQSCSKTERHFCILLSYIRLRWPELSCRLFASSYISKVVTHELKATRESIGRAKCLPMKCFVFV